MKIAVGLAHPSLQSEMELDFRHTRYFGIVDTFWGNHIIFETPLEEENVPINTDYLAEKLIAEGVDVIITGLCETGAFHKFENYCIPVFEGFFGTGAAALRQFNMGRLKSFEKVDVK